MSKTYKIYGNEFTITEAQKRYLDMFYDIDVKSYNARVYLNRFFKNYSASKNTGVINEFKSDLVASIGGLGEGIGRDMLGTSTTLTYKREFDKYYETKDKLISTYTSAIEKKVKSLTDDLIEGKQYVEEDEIYEALEKICDGGQKIADYYENSFNMDFAHEMEAKISNSYMSKTLVPYVVTLSDILIKHSSLNKAQSYIASELEAFLNLKFYTYYMKYLYEFAMKQPNDLGISSFMKQIANKAIEEAFDDQGLNNVLKSNSDEYLEMLLNMQITLFNDELNLPVDDSFKETRKEAEKYFKFTTNERTKEEEKKQLLFKAISLFPIEHEYILYAIKNYWDKDSDLKTLAIDMHVNYEKVVMEILNEKDDSEDSPISDIELLEDAEQRKAEIVADLEEYLITDISENELYEKIENKIEEIKIRMRTYKKKVYDTLELKEEAELQDEKLAETVNSYEDNDLANLFKTTNEIVGNPEIFPEIKGYNLALICDKLKRGLKKYNNPPTEFWQLKMQQTEELIKSVGDEQPVTEQLNKLYKQFKKKYNSSTGFLGSIKNIFGL